MKTQEKSERKGWLERRRSAHHKALETLAKQVGCNTTGLRLWRQLRRLENHLMKCCENYSNHGSYGTARWEKDKSEAKTELSRIFGGKIPDGIFINGDPRGHMIKLEGPSAGEPGVLIPEGMQKDWGSNGILAAEITEED